MCLLGEVVLIQVTTWMNLENTIPIKRSQFQNTTCNMILFILNVLIGNSIETESRPWLLRSGEDLGKV